MVRVRFADRVLGVRFVRRDGGPSVSESGSDAGCDAGDAGRDGWNSGAAIGSSVTSQEEDNMREGARGVGACGAIAGVLMSWITSGVSFRKMVTPVSVASDAAAADISWKSSENGRAPATLDGASGSSVFLVYLPEESRVCFLLISSGVGWWFKVKPKPRS